MQSVFAHLEADCQRYRFAIDRLLDANHVQSDSMRGHFLEVRVTSSQLYLDYATLYRDLPQIKTTCSKHSADRQQSRAMERERDLRTQFKTRLRPSQIWTHFRPNNSFSEMNRLTCLDDYLNSIELHLPEIYGETIRIEAQGIEFLRSNDSGSLADVLVGLEHTGRNHISFVLRALDWLVDEISWDY